MLTSRQELVLRKVVEEYLEAGVPVGSKALSVDVQWGPSTIRHELASLEELGLLAHPHTSAGRIPTDAGYRYFVDRLLPRDEVGPRLSLSPVFTELEDGAHDSLYVEGTSRLLRADRLGEVSELNALMDMLETRVTLLGVLQTALTERDVLVRIGAENEAPGLRSLALVAAAYGLPQRRLGTVSVIGPLRMDYGRAIHAVRDAASQLSSFIAEVYDER